MSAITVCDAPNPRGLSWSSAGVLIFAANFQSTISKVSADGGTPEQITRLDTSRNESSHRWPFALPDGKHFLFFARTSATSGTAEGHAVYVGSIDGTTSKLLLHISSNAIYASGYILYVQGSTLMAQQFDQSSVELKGDPLPVAENVLDDPGFNLSVITASQNGLLLFQTGHAQAGAKLLIMDREGKLLSTLGESIEQFRVHFTPDDRHILVSIYAQKLLRLNIWMYDLTTGSKDRITSGMGEDFPIISPDGNRIIYSVLRDRYSDLVQQNLSNQLTEKLEGDTVNTDFALDWSNNDSSVLFFHARGERSHGNLWIMTMDGKHERRQLHATQFNELGGRFSPDGKLVAYTSDESGQNEIYITSAVEAGGQSWKISTEGGTFPRWGANNSELFFIDNSNAIRLAMLRYKDNAVEVVSSVKLFTAPIFLDSYDVSHDGKKIVLCPLLEHEQSVPLTLMEHWDAELKKQ